MEVTVGDGVIHYLDRGDAVGEPVTLLHGFTQSSRSWEEVIRLLPPGHRFLVPDLRGHGLTRLKPDAPVTMTACLGDLEAIWAAAGVERTHLAGYSMGGRLALHGATHRPDRLLSLTTIGAHAGLPDDMRAERIANDGLLAARIEERGVEEFVNYWSSLPLFAGLERRGPGFQAALRSERLKNRAAGLAASLRGMGAGAMEPVWDRLGAIHCPCLFVAGADDHGYAHEARRLEAAVAAGRAEIVPRAGHAVHLERPQAFASLLAAHLDQSSNPADQSSA